MQAQTLTAPRWSPWWLTAVPLTCTDCQQTAPVSEWVRGDGHGRIQCGVCGDHPAHRAPRTAVPR